MVEKCSLPLSDKLLAEAKALVGDPAAFTREMTRILREKQSHPLIAQMMKPAESSDPPPTTAADSSSGAEPYTVNPYSFSELLEPNVGYPRLAYFYDCDPEVLSP